MRLLRWFVLVLAALCVAALVALWVVPPRLDLNNWRDDLARLASDRLGGTVRIAGPITLRLLPEPILTAGGVSLASSSAALGISAGEMRLRVALGPLLAGRAQARELVLRGAELRLPWPLQAGALRLRAPGWLSNLSAQVEDGRLQLGTIALTGIAARLATDAYTGTYSAAGIAHVSGREWRFTARLTQPGSDGSVGVDVALDGQGAVQGAGGTLTGQIAPDGSFAGRIAARGPDLALLLPAPAVPFRAEGRVTAAGGLAAADDLALEIGGAPAHGAVALRISPRTRLDLALAASRIDLDAWLPVLLRPNGAVLPTGIDLSAEAAPLAGGLLRRLRMAVDLAPGGADIRELHALLPGDAALQLSGHVASATGGPRFEGLASLTAPALRATLAWIRAAGVTPLVALPDGVLRSATLTAHVAADSAQIVLGGIAGEVDGSRLTGSLTLRRGARPAVAATLAVDRIDLDLWLPAQPGEALARFAGFDLDLTLAAQQAMLHGMTVTKVSAEASAGVGRLTLRKLDFDIGGVHGTAAATLGAGGVLSDGQLDLAAPQASALAPLLPERLAALGHRAPKLWRSAASVQMRGAGPPGALALKLAAEFGDLRLAAEPMLDLPHGTWTAAMTLRHPGAPRLLDALGVTDAPAWLGDGSLGLVAHLSGAPATLAADSFALTAGSLHATGALLLDRAGAQPEVTGHIETETLPLPLPDAGSPDPLPLSWLAGWGGRVQVSAGRVLADQAPALLAAQATLSLAADVLRVEHLTGRLAGGTLAASGSVDAGAATPAFATSFDLIGAMVSEPVFGLPLDLAGGTLDAHATLTAEGFAPAALLATLGGDIRLDAAGGVLAGVALAKAESLTEADVQAALSGGTTPFDALAVAARVEHGVVTLRQASLSAPSGRATLAGTIDLAEQAADFDLRFRPASADAPEIGLRLSGGPAARRRTPDLAALIRWHGAQAAASP